MTKAERIKIRNTVLYVLFLVIWTFASVVASQLLVGFLFLLLLGKEGLASPVWSAISAFLSYALTIVLVILVPPNIKKLKQKPASRNDLGLRNYPTWTDIGLAPVGYIASSILGVIAATIFSLFPWFNASEVQDVGFDLYLDGGEKAIAFVVLVVLAPIAEEVVFRGWLYGKLREKLNVPVAILITSILFGVVHFQWNVGVNVFALSVVLCGLREVTGTIYAGIITHMIKNGVAVYLLYALHV